MRLIEKPRPGEGGSQTMKSKQTTNQQESAMNKTMTVMAAIVAATLTLGSNAKAQNNVCDTDKEPLKGFIAQLQAATGQDCSDNGKSLTVANLAAKGCSNATLAKQLVDGFCSAPAPAAVQPNAGVTTAPVANVVPNNAPKTVKLTAGHIASVSPVSSMSPELQALYGRFYVPRAGRLMQLRDDWEKIITITFPWLGIVIGQVADKKAELGALQKGNTKKAADIALGGLDVLAPMPEAVKAKFQAFMDKYQDEFTGLNNALESIGTRNNCSSVLNSRLRDTLQQEVDTAQAALTTAETSKDQTEIRKAKGTLKKAKDALIRFNAEQPKAWACNDPTPKDIEKFVDLVSAMDRSRLSTTDQLAVEGMIKKAKEDYQLREKVLQASLALDILAPVAPVDSSTALAANCGAIADEFNTLLSGLLAGREACLKGASDAAETCGELVKIDGQNVVLKVKKADSTFAEVSIPRDGSEMRLPEQVIVDSEPAISSVGTSVIHRTGDTKWVPPFNVSPYLNGHMGTSSDTQHGQNYKVESKGYEAGIQLSFDGVWKLLSWLNAIYGADLRVGYRETAFRHELAADGVFTKSHGVSFSGGGKLGVNFGNWVSVYGLALGRANPAGYELGGGIALTGISWFRVGVEGAYAFARNHADTGYGPAAPADFRGASGSVVLGVQF
jgi:hypothetical protein